MNNLIQSLPSPSAYSGGITHRWMGETWIVDGEASVMMMAMISSNSPSRQGARTPEIGFSMAAELRNSFWKNFEPPSVFRSEGLSSRKGSPRRCPRWPHLVQAQQRGGGRLDLVWVLWASKWADFLAPAVFRGSTAS